MNFSKYSEYLEYLISLGVPSVEVIINKNHETIYHEIRGFSDSQKSVKANTNDLYFLYSSSKVLTCTAIMKLLEESKDIKLSSPIFEFLPEWKDPIVHENGVEKVSKRQITIEDLMTMSAGLTYDTYTKNVRNFLAQNKNATARELSSAIAKDGLIFEPGTRMAYSLCHDVLFALIESVTGKRASEYVKSKILEPLGIKDLYYHSEGIENRISQQYSMRKNGDIYPVAKINEYILSPNYDSGGAGVITTCTEYAKLLDMLACNGIGKNGEQILSSESIDNMRQNRLDSVRLKDFYNRANGMRCYGYGLGVQTLIEQENYITGNKSLSNIGEFGWGGAAGANMTIDPKENLSVLFLMHVLNYPVPTGENAYFNDNYRFRTRDLAYIGLKNN